MTNNIIKRLQQNLHNRNTYYYLVCIIGSNRLTIIIVCDGLKIATKHENIEHCDNKEKCKWPIVARQNKQQRLDGDIYSIPL